MCHGLSLLVKVGRSSAVDRARIDAAWKRFTTATEHTLVVADVLAMDTPGVTAAPG
jgi:hypothetical protein